jgi:hypothetical protein
MCRITTYQLGLDALRCLEHEALPIPGGQGMEKDCFLLLRQQSFNIKNELSGTILSTTRSPLHTAHRSRKAGKSRK